MQQESSQLATILVAALGGILTTGIPLFLAWFKARTTLEEQKARAAVLYVEALTSDKRDMSNAEKRDLAIKMINPTPTRSQQAVLGERVDAHVPAVKAELERVTKPD